MSAAAAVVAVHAYGMSTKKNLHSGKNIMVKISIASQFNSIIESS
ncbi:hypothetical protein PSM_B0371 [Pseudoalteromonas sp. SM9913]|jgi:hypothetical protein|nr:hypothetical protein PSM_B0371 [Pseudoalteromonas sp. SM9913]